MYRRWLRATGVALCASLCLLAWAEQGKTPKKQTPRLPRRAAVDAYILGPTALVAGSSASYRVAVHWASSPKRSGPLPGAEVALSLVEKGKQPRELHLIRGRTSGQGSADLRFVVPGLKTIKTGPKTLKVRVRSALGNAAREQEVRVFPGGKVLLTTDKKLYQPSQLIHIRALALRSIDLKPVAGRQVRLRVFDPKGNAVFDHRGRTSRFGIASADFQLADEINLGHYTIEAWAEGANQGGRSSKRVEVKRYVLPKFKVTVEAERAYYRPGETLRGTVRCRYFFGKPVAGAKVSLEVRHRLGRGVVGYVLPATAARVTDAAGRHPFEVTLSSHASRGDLMGEVRVTAKVVDTANHREEGDLSLPLTASPLRLSVVPENDRLVPGVHNRVHVVAGYPDGAPAKNATVTLGKASKRTDGLGVASFQLMPRASGRVCGGGGDDDDDGNAERKMALNVTARDALGQRGAAEVCAPIAPRRAVLVRPARSLVTPGQPVELELFAAPARTLARGQVFVDVVKAGQTLATFTRSLARGRTRVSFVPDTALFGLLELRAYRLRPDGQRVGASRMVYVDHPGELKIKARADRAVYRPGGRARLTFEVSDSRTGDGVEAALGLLGVDEAVVAMGGLERSAPKVFFTLANQAKGEPDLEVPPGGRDLEHWVTSAEAIARRDRAADVLLAAVQPAEVPVWETNPWKERRETWQQLAPELVSAAVAFMRDHSVGIKTARGWRFHPELVPRMARAKAIKPEKVTDPWRRTVRPWHLHETDASFVFNHHARRLAPEKLERIYNAFDEVWEQLKLKRERMRKLPRRKWPLVLPRDLLQRLVTLGKLKPADIVDPWGQPYRVGFNPRLFVNPYHTGLVSRYLIHSTGPDGVSGTKDDVGPSGPRVAVNVFGVDSALGSDAEIALGGLIGNQIGESYGVGGLGLIGTGRGGGGSGSGYGYGVGRLGARGGSMPARVRSVFPETLLWHPELITTMSGRATLDVDLADSITTWRVQATGSTTNGLLGSAELTLRVFQDFFVDIDVPVSLTQKDRVSVPVTVYNYLKTPQRVTLRLQREKWFVPKGPLQQTVELGPSEVKVRYFPIVAHRVGRQDLTVHASAAGKDGARVADAVRRSTLVEPDGIEHASARAGSLRDEAAHELEIPAGAIPGTERVLLAMYSGPMGQTLDGLEGMLRKPYGCFEQTSSTTYPNVLVLDYLKRTGKATPKLERRARELINEGYQRLVGFEVAGGGFSWFGNAPANKILTAYGLMEFYDMSRVHPVDPKLIARTQRWLASQQKPDGSWGPDGYSINEGATNNFQNDLLRITAYIAHALRHTGYKGTALAKALRYVRRQARSARDPYTLAVLGNLLARDNDKAAGWVRARLWAQRRSSDKGLSFEGPRSTLTYGAGRSGGIETTALAALAYLAHGEMPAGGERMIESLVASKDSFGSWHSTQATILSLRALLLDHQRSSVRTAGEVQVLVDNRPAGRIRIKAGEDRTRQLDLTPFARAGRHRIALRFAGKGSLQYNLVGRYWLPRSQEAERPVSRGSLAIRTRFDRHQVKRDGKLQLDVEVSNRGRQRVEMPLVSLALPPGFAVKEEAFTALVKAGKVDKVQRIGSRAVLYLTRLGAGQALRFAVPLRGRYPLKVQARPSVVYEYYRPENRGESEPKVLQVL